MKKIIQLLIGSCLMLTLVSGIVLKVPAADYLGGIKEPYNVSNEVLTKGEQEKLSFVRENFDKFTNGLDRLRIDYMGDSLMTITRTLESGGWSVVSNTVTGGFSLSAEYRKGSDVIYLSFQRYSDWAELLIRGKGNNLRDIKGALYGFIPSAMIDVLWEQMAAYASVGLTLSSMEDFKTIANYYNSKATVHLDSVDYYELDRYDGKIRNAGIAFYQDSQEMFICADHYGINFGYNSSEWMVEKFSISWF